VLLVLFTEGNNRQESLTVIDTVENLSGGAVNADLAYAAILDKER
jgi:hypothetical protein